MRYFLGFLVTIGLIVLIIVLLLSGHGSKTPAVKPLDLTNYINQNSAVQVTIDGPVVADQNHRALQIVVDENTVTATVYQGYEQSVLTTKTYPNNHTAYDAFMRSLQHDGFTLYNKGITSDERGYCPTGDRYIVSLTNNGSDVRRTWATSCGSSVKGSFAGPINTVLNLFQAQVPDYNTLTYNVQL